MSAARRRRKAIERRTFAEQQLATPTPYRPGVVQYALNIVDPFEHRRPTVTPPPWHPGHPDFPGYPPAAGALMRQRVDYRGRGA